MDDRAGQLLEDEITHVCGTLNATANRLVALIAQALEPWWASPIPTWAARAWPAPTTTATWCCST
ncbi:MAG: hypothetical protein ACR2HY_00270 [Acidimicrobiales bacterium]